MAEPFVEVSAVEGGKRRTNVVEREAGVAVEAIAEELEIHSQSGGIMARFQNECKTN